jgi:hypothetical protein
MPVIIVACEPACSDGNALIGRIGRAEAGSPSTSISERHRSDQAASCSWTTLRQPTCWATPSFSDATRPGSASWASPRATAASPATHTIWPGRVFQCQDHMNGPSVFGAISEPSICTDNAAAIATRLPEYLVRHTPRSCSIRSDVSPRPSPSNDASTATSISPSSIFNSIT